MKFISNFRTYSRTLTASTRAQLRYVRNDFRSLSGNRARHKDLRQCESDGFSILVDVEEEVGRQIYQRTFEREEARFLKSNLRTTDICLDVGANIGYFSLLMAVLAPAGQVHAFEPVPFNLQLLQVNAQLNGLSNLQAYPYAVGEVPGKLAFTVAEDSAYSSFLDTGRKPIDKTIEVVVTPIDQFCEDLKLLRVDVLKVDTEGAEPRVLAGASNLLGDRDRQPRFVILELFEPMLSRYNSTIDGIVDQMAQYGYHPQIEDRPGHLRAFTAKDHNVHYNVFFTRLNS